MFYEDEEKPFEILDTFEGQAVIDNRGAEDVLFALIREYVNRTNRSKVNSDYNPKFNKEELRLGWIVKGYSIIVFRADKGIGGRMVAKGDKMWRTSAIFCMDEKDARDMFNILSKDGRPLMTYRDWYVRRA